MWNAEEGVDDMEVRPERAVTSPGMSGINALLVVAVTIPSCSNFARQARMSLSPVRIPLLSCDFEKERLSVEVLGCAR